MLSPRGMYSPIICSSAFMGGGGGVGESTDKPRGLGGLGGSVVYGKMALSEWASQKYPIQGLDRAGLGAHQRGW
jgi:hypothetical protein